MQKEKQEAHLMLRKKHVTQSLNPDVSMGKPLSSLVPCLHHECACKQVSRQPL